MERQDLSSIVLTVEPRPDSIRDAAARLLAALATPGAEGDGELSEQAMFFVEEVYRIVLNWMATGEEQSFRELLGQLRMVLIDRPRAERIEALPAAGQLAARLGCVLELGAVYLRTDNLAKSLGALSGQRRAGWRRALQWIYGEDRPVRVAELRDAGLFDNDNSANFALNRLAGMGFLAKVREGPKAVVFELTWVGRSVCRVLGLPARPPAPEPPGPEPAQSDAEEEEKRSDWLGIPDGVGFSDQRMGEAVGLNRQPLVQDLFNARRFALRPEVRP